MNFNYVVGNQQPKVELIMKNQIDRVSIMVVVLSLIFILVWKLF